MHDENLKERIDTLDRAVFGDRNNLKEMPGIISELSQMNTTLKEVRDAMKRINFIIITAFITSLCVLVFKGIG